MKKLLAFCITFFATLTYAESNSQSMAELLRKMEAGRVVEAGEHRQREQYFLQNKNEQHEAYKAGRILLTEYSQALMAYKKAKQDIWQAEYDLLQILID